MRAAVLPATKAPKVSTRRSDSGRSDKAVLPPAGELVGAVAELVDEHGAGVGAGRDGRPDRRRGTRPSTWSGAPGTSHRPSSGWVSVPSGWRSSRRWSATNSSGVFSAEHGMPLAWPSAISSSRWRVASRPADRLAQHVVELDAHGPVLPHLVGQLGRRPHRLDERLPVARRVDGDVDEPVGHAATSRSAAGRSWPAAASPGRRRRSGGSCRPGWPSPRGRRRPGPARRPAAARGGRPRCRLRPGPRPRPRAGGRASTAAAPPPDRRRTSGRSWRGPSSASPASCGAGRWRRRRQEARHDGRAAPRQPERVVDERRRQGWPPWARR